MSDMTIKTNGHRRHLMSGRDLTPDEAKEFDYLDPEYELPDAEFVRYKGNIYAMDEFMRVSELSLRNAGWEGIHTETFFSAILVKYDKDDTDYVIMGRAYS